VELLLEQMDPEQARDLRLCAIPHEFDPAILRALVPELSEEESRERCETFSKLSMVATRDERLAMHQESRRHLFEQWLTDHVGQEFVAANKRLVAEFDNRAARLQQQSATDRADPLESAERNRMFHLIGASRRDGLAEFERLCRKRREQLRLGECETLIKLVHEYDRVLSPLEAALVAYHEAKLAGDRQQWTIAEELFNRVLATESVPEQLRVKTLCRLGMINDEQRRWNPAIDFFKKGLQLADARLECSEQIVHLHLNLGSTYRDLGDLPRSEEFLSKGIDLAKDAHNISSLADGYNSLGTLYLRLNDNRRAVDTYQTSLKFLDELGDKFRRAQVYNNLGNAYANERDWPKSEQFFRQSLEIKRQAGDNPGQAMTLTNLVRVYRSQQQTERAIEASEQAAALFAEVRDDYNMAVVKRNLGRIYRSMGSIDLARSALREAADLFARRNENDEAKMARKEASDLDRKFSLPWWVVLAIVLVILVVVAALIGR
jgi:tetratricopeptide (TPR) repeat protein